MNNKSIIKRLPLLFGGMFVVLTSLTSFAAADRAAMAYKLNSTASNKNIYQISFGVTSSAVTNAFLVLTDGTNSYEFDLGDVQKGMNTKAIDLTEYASLPEGTYNWAIKVNSTVEGTEGELVEVYAAEANSDRTSATSDKKYGAGGIAVLNNPELDNFGEVVVFHPFNEGITILDPTMTEKTKYGPFGFNASRQSGMHLSHYGDKLVTADFTDGHSGYYLYDPANPTQAPVQMLQGTRDSNGIFTYNGTQIGGSSSAAAFTKDGKYMYVFDEDLATKNRFKRYEINNSEIITSAPTKTYGFATTQHGSGYANCVLAKDGVFFTDYRYTATAANPALVFYNQDGTKIYSAEASEVASGIRTCNSVNGGIAVNDDETLLAFVDYPATSQSGAHIQVMDITWTKNASDQYVPSFSNVRRATLSTYGSDLEFDKVGNLYIARTCAATSQSPYFVYAFAGDHTYSTPAKSSSTMVKVSNDVPSLYAVTNWNGDVEWDPTTARMMEYDKGIYTVTLPAGVNQFKISTKRGDWDTFNSAVYIVGSNMVVGDCRDSKVYDLHQGSYNDGATDNIVLAEAADAWTVYVDLYNMKIWAEQPLKLYVRGSMTDWNADSAWQLTEGDNQVYTLTGVNLNAEHEWKISEAPMTWNKYNNYDGEQDGFDGWERHNYGGATGFKPNRLKNIEDGGTNCSLLFNVSDAIITFDHANKTIKVSSSSEAVRPAYAYDFDAYANADGETATVSFKSTAAGKGRVILVPTPLAAMPPEEAQRHNIRSQADMFTKDNVDICEGENSFQFYVNDFDPENVYGVEVEFDHADNGAFQVVESYDGASSSTRGGVAVINDANSPLFGYIISSNGNDQGLWIHKPDLSAPNKYIENMPFLSDNTTSSYRMCYYGGKAYVSDYSPANGGIYTWDPVTPNEPASIIYENATYSAPWWMDADDNIIGGRATTVKVIENEGTPEVWAFISNPSTWNNYHIMGSTLNANGKIDSAPVYDFVKSDNYASGKLGNQNVEMWHSKLHNGWWVCQERGNGFNTNANPSFMFVSLDGGHANIVEMSSTVEGVDGGRNAIAVNEDESLLFYSTRDGDIAVCDIEWNGNVPTVTFVQTIANTRNVNGYYQFDFDPAGNLVAWGAGSQIKVIAVEQKARTKKMAAPDFVSFTVNNDGTMTSVKDIAAEQDSNAVYYNVNGVKVSSESMTPGIYVKVCGNKATKVVVK